MKYISAKTRLQWSQVIWMVIFWCLMGLLLGLYKSVNYDLTTQEFIFAAPKGYHLWQFLLINLIGPLIAGFSGGVLIVFVLKEKLRTKSYWSFILILGLVFFAFILFLNTSVSFIFYYRDQLSNPEMGDFVSYFIMDPYALRNILSWMVIGFVTMAMLQVADKYGPGVFLKFIKGKYHIPREEERIFMFLDINDSTGLAERLGNMQFFKLLHTFYADITDSIINHEGEIYQYVGDEIVVSWNTVKGLKNSQCMRCIFDIKQVIAAKTASYQQRFGIIPEFKAGMHIGKVVAGEIGIIKKEIVYSGDIMNTTSRILEFCKSYQQKLIITQALYERLEPKEKVFCYSELGHVQLRGKGEFLILWGVAKCP